MELLLPILVLVDGCMVIAAVEPWRRMEQTSKWEIQLAKLSVDTQITIDTLEADTIAGCAFHCSSTKVAHAWSLYFVPETRTCHCNNDLDTNPEDGSMAQIYYGTLKTLTKKETNGQEQRTLVWPPKDCLTLYHFEYLEDGVYEIYPKGGAKTTTWCDMTNGGWTVIQTRKDGSENFNRGWTDYVNGFGNKSGEYWLGLDNIHYLTKNGSDLQIHLEAFPGVTPPSLSANYSSFTVGNGASEYVVHMSGYTGDACGDSFSVHDGMAFSTWDNDNDDGIMNCASHYGGGWWFKQCHSAFLNGYYYPEGEYSNAATGPRGIHWAQCWYYQHSMKSSSMSARRHF